MAEIPRRGYKITGREIDNGFIISLENTNDIKFGEIFCRDSQETFKQVKHWLERFVFSMKEKAKE